MATNVPVQHFNCKRITLSAAVETAIVLENVVIIRYLRVTLDASAAYYISFDAGGTFSADNFVELPSGAMFEVEDIAVGPADAIGTFFYARASAGTPALQVIYGTA